MLPAEMLRDMFDGDDREVVGGRLCH
jgi:hypothetical protein